MGCWAPSLEILVQYIWDGAQEPSFFTSSKLRPRLPFNKPQGVAAAQRNPWNEMHLLIFDGTEI